MNWPLLRCLFPQIFKDPEPMCEKTTDTYPDSTCSSAPAYIPPVLDAHAKVAWLLRQKEVEAAMDLPPGPYRLIRNTEFGTWSVQSWSLIKDQPDPDAKKLEALYFSERERATYRRRQYPIIPHDHLLVTSEMDYGYVWNNAAVRVYRDEFLRWQDEPVMRVVWSSFGETKSFNTYAEAEAWLKGWMNPIADEVYFDAAGKRVSP